MFRIYPRRIPDRSCCCVGAQLFRKNINPLHSCWQSQIKLDIKQACTRVFTHFASSSDFVSRGGGSLRNFWRQLILTMPGNSRLFHLEVIYRTTCYTMVTKRKAATRRPVSNRKGGLGGVQVRSVYTKPSQLIARKAEMKG